MAESLEFVKRHKVAVGVGAAAIVLLYLLSNRSSAGTAAASGGVNPLQIAQLQASANLQSQQIQAQQNTATLGAQVTQNQNEEALQASEAQLAAEVAGTAYQAQVAEQQTTTQGSIYKELIDTGAAEQEAQLQAETTLGTQAIDLTNKGGRTNAGVNELALITGQGNVGSYNSATASQGIAGTLAQASIINGLTKAGSSLLGSLF